MVSGRDIEVSVILPVYNAEKYLETALMGVMDQTLKEIEIICVDDGSTDRTAGILEKLAKNDSRISIITQEHKNAGAARNRGLKEAKGKYLSFLDADDIFEAEMLEKTYRDAEEKRADIVVFRSDRYNETTGCYEEAGWSIKEELLPGGDVFSFQDDGDIFSGFVGWPWDKLINRELVRTGRITFQEQRTINDMYFVHSALALAGRITVLDSLLIHKRVGVKKSITSNYSGLDASWDMFRALEGIKEYLERIYDSTELCNKRLNAAIYYTLWNLDKNLDSKEYDEIFYLTRDRFLPALGIKAGGYETNCRPELQRKVDNLFGSDSREYRWQRRLERKDNTYLFPFELVPKGSRIVLYGAGRVGQAYYRQMKFSGWCEIVSWVDIHPEGKNGLVSDISAIDKIRYDYTVIAIRDKKMAKQIRHRLIEHGISDDRIFWKAPEIEL